MMNRMIPLYIIIIHALVYFPITINAEEIQSKRIYSPLSLSESILSAKESSTQLMNIKGQLRRSKSESGLKWLSLLPQFNIDYTSRQETRLFYPDIDQSLIRYQLKQPIFQSASLITSTIFNKSKIVSLEREKYEIEKEIAMNVRLLYSHLKLTSEQIEFSSGEVQLWNQMKAISIERFKIGEIPEIDLKQIKINENQAKLRYQDNCNRFFLTLNQFSLLTELELSPLLNQFNPLIDDKKDTVAIPIGFQSSRALYKLSPETFIDSQPINHHPLNTKEIIQRIAINNSYSLFSTHYQLNQNSDTKKSIYCSFLPSIEYNLEFSTLEESNYHQLNPLQHSLQFQITIPGISFSASVGTQTSPGNNQFFGESGSTIDSTYYPIISQLVYLKEQKIELEQIHRQTQSNLLRTIEVKCKDLSLKRDQLELGIVLSELKKQELEIARLQYQNGEIPLYRFNSQQEEYRQSKLAIFSEEQTLYQFIEDFAFLCGITPGELYEKE